MPTWLTIMVSVLGSAAVFSFVEFLIKRHDNKKGLMAQLVTEVTSLRKEFEEGKAIDSRRRILQFSDGLIHEERRHSKEYFDQVMDDITMYEKYCDEHKDFKNNKALASIAHIKKIYNERLEKKDFL